MATKRGKKSTASPTPDSPGASQTPPHQASPQDMAAQFTHLMGSLQGMSIPFQALSEVQLNYVQEAAQLWNQSLTNQWAQGAGLPGLADRRFSGPDWQNNPAAAFTAQMYLLNARTLTRLAEHVEGDAKLKARLRFAVQQWVDAAAPSNYLALNPEAQRLALDTKGESIAHGLQHLWHDLQQGHLSQTDEDQFEVGRNLATTEGAVVFENPYFQLIEYKPLSGKVHARPLLFVPPCINKYYILDLQPDSSLVRYAVSQGHRLFMVSWRNADESLAQASWDDYIEHGVITAIEQVRAITGCDAHHGLNALGFCVGGTLLGTALAVLAAREVHPVASLTLLTTFLDFSDTGVMDLFIDENTVRMREVSIGAESPSKGGLLNGKELASTFSFLRPNDLVWNYVVGNYLKGETPPPFDLLYWNSDSTNLPGPMYCWYLRHTYLENKLCVPGAVTVCGESIDFSKISCPAYLLASREDHIVPWASAYASLKLLKGPTRFVMGASGHIAGVINPPQKKKRHHWVQGGRGKAPADAEQWLHEAKEVAGSWWPDWSDWLAGHAGPMVNAPKTYGDRAHPVIEPAPGRYVKVRI